MPKRSFSIGVDYGTNSVRALIVDTKDGNEISTSVYNYPSGEAGILLDPKDPNVARQNVNDYIEGFFTVVADALAKAELVDGFSRDQVVGIGVDTTGSTPIPVDDEGVPLSFQDRFKDNLAAQAWLWKDHSSHEEAAEITEKAKAQGLPYLEKCGGAYSSEWYFSKVLHCMRTAPEVADAAHTWVECSDYIPAFLTGTTHPSKLKRDICAAGHKAMFSDEWGGYPSAEFLSSLDPRLGALRERLPNVAFAADQKAGGLTAEVAEKVGLPEGLPVAVGAFDAHLGAVGSGVKLGTMVKIMGTSTCDIAVIPMSEKTPPIPGLAGIVSGSVIPGMYGLEAGQSAVGDLFNWFVGHLCPAEFDGSDVHEKLNLAAAKLKPGESGLIALDWNNGNRNILTDPLLSGLLVGQTLHTTAPEVYRALIEATAFGALTIINRIEECGVAINEIINCGGIAEKSPMTMQIYADVCNRSMTISRSSQTCALGAAVFGAVVGGAHATTEAAQSAMTGVKAKRYDPIPENVAVYKRLYKLYKALHDAFGTNGYSESLYPVMKELISIRTEVRSGITGQ